MRLRNALLAATVLAAPFALTIPAVHAQPVDGLYIAGGAGGNFLQNETVKSITANGPRSLGKGTNYRLDLGPVVVASVGYGLGNGLRFELQGALYSNKFNKVSTGGAFPTSNAGGEEQKQAVFLNALYDFDIDSPVVPYIGAGVGYVHNRFNNFHVAGYNQYLRSTGQNEDSMRRKARVCVSASGDARVPTRSGRP